MDFGVFFLLGSPAMLPSRVVYQRTLDYIRYADELGYDSVWIAEHHFSNYGYVPNPLMFAIKAAQETHRVRVGTAVLVLPFWHPLRVAEEIAMADQLTDGRLEVGVARGYQRYEFNRFGLNFDEARERTEEVLEVMLHALKADGFTYEGAHFAIGETTIFPKSLQRPHPPIWLAAQTPESFDASVRLGLRTFTSGSARPVEIVECNWGYFCDARDKYQATSPVHFAVQQQLCVAPTDAEARQQMEHFRYAYRQVANLRAGTERIEGGHAYELPVEGEPTLDQFFETHTLSGSPDTVRAKIEAYLRVAPGLSQLNCTFSMGAMQPDVVRRSMRLFAEEVMPHFR